MLRLVLLILMALTQAVSFIYTLLVWEPNAARPLIFLAFSASIFSTFCVDLARDQLQNIAYFPITNLLFLVTFSFCCAHSCFKKIMKFWSLIQLIAFIIYIFHEQYTIRQIIYRIMENDRSFKGLVLILLGVMTCLLIHLGFGTVIKMIIEKNTKITTHMKDLFQQLEQMVKKNQANEQQQQQHIFEDKQIFHSKREDQNYLFQLFKNFKELPQIIKTVLIVVPPLIDIFSWIIQLFVTQDSHSHSHTHTHLYFTKQKLYFQDITSQSRVSMLFIGVRTVCSAIIFHTLLGLWNKVIASLDKDRMKQKFQLAIFGLGFAICRMLSERF